jgi:hypothetical protein
MTMWTPNPTTADMLPTRLAIMGNMPSFADGVAGIDFSNQLRRQAERFGVELLQAQDVALRRQDNYHVITTQDGSEYSACALLISTGSRYRRLNVPGERNYIGAGIHFCATCDGPFYKGKEVAVVGSGVIGFQPVIFDNSAGSPAWSPLWNHFTVTWNEGVEPSVIQSSADLRAAIEAGDLALFNGTSDTHPGGFVVNCPVLILAPNTVEG